MPLRFLSLVFAVLLAATVIGCSCNPAGRWVQSELEKADESLASTGRLVGTTLEETATLDGWRAAVKPGLDAAAENIERDTAYASRTAGEITDTLAEETAEIVPFTANAVDSAVAYTSDGVRDLGRWFFCGY